MRRLPCCAIGLPYPDSGVTHRCHSDWHREAHHAGKRPGTGIKCSDLETHSFCRLAHRQWHGGFGVFKGWTRAQRRAWADEAIAFTQAQLNHLIKRPADV